MSAEELYGSSVETIATSAQRFLCAVGDWAPTGESTALSQRAFVLEAYHYQNFVAQFGDDQCTFFVLAATNANAVELHTIISYPDRRGHGKIVMQQLCDLADKLGVTIWLNALPFGAGREHIPFKKLKSIYQSFGFFPVREIDRRWINGYHAWEKSKFRHPMIRNPKSSN